MKRALLLLVFMSSAAATLLWLAGGLTTTGDHRAEPEVRADTALAETAPAFVPPTQMPISVDGWEDFSMPARPEPLKFEDAQTGESVLIPDFIRWHFHSRSGHPVEATSPGRQAVIAEDVEVVTHREPQDMDEARTLAHGGPGAYAKMVKWRVTAPAARVDDLALASLDATPGGTETVIQLSGGVRIVDEERGMVIEGEALEVQPYLDRATGTGRFDVHHEAFHLQGDDLTVRREDSRTRIEIDRRTEVQFFGDPPGPDGRPLFDLGPGGLQPGHLSAEGGAVIDHRAETGGLREDMTIELERRVHAEQAGGRSLDAESVRIEAYALQKNTPPDTEEAPDQPDANGDTKGAKKRWRIERFDADGGALIEYPGETSDGKPYRISTSARHIIHVVRRDNVSTTLLEGSPEITIYGEIPFRGLADREGPGVLRLSASDQISLEPAPAADVPPGAEPTLYRVLRLRGDAHLSVRGSGLDPAEDTLEGDSMEMLLRDRSDEEMAAIRKSATLDPVTSSPTHAQIVAVSFAVLGDVRLGGTRMSGMTHRLVAHGLDTPSPRLVAEGSGTSFSFHGLKRGERFLGGTPDGASASSETGSETPSQREKKPEWLLHRLDAQGAVVVTTTVGGPAIGMPARLEGTSLAYDRVSDEARLVGALSAPARLSVGATEKGRQQIEATSMRLDRNGGLIEAGGRVRGIVFLSHGSGDGSGLGSAFPMPDRRLGEAVTLGLATNGRIEIDWKVRTAPWRPIDRAEQIIRIEGGLLARLTSDTLDEDRLEAETLELALVRTMPDTARTASPTTTLPTSRASSRGPRPTAAGADERSPRPSPPLTRWDLSTSRLRARFSGAGFASFEATGGVRFESEDGSIVGTSVRYDAQTRHARVLGNAKAAARASFGPADARSLVQAHELGLMLGADGPVELAARGDPFAVLIRRSKEVAGAIDRFDVKCTGAIVMTSEKFVTDSYLEIQRWRRQRPGAPWETPFRLWADRAVVTGAHLLSSKTADVRRLVASGPRTALRLGTGDDRTTVRGQRFELDVSTSKATLEGTPDNELTIWRGPDDTPFAISEQTRILIDLETGELYDWNNPRVILRGRGPGGIR